MFLLWVPEQADNIHLMVLNSTIRSIVSEGDVALVVSVIGAQNTTVRTHNVVFDDVTTASSTMAIVFIALQAGDAHGQLTVSDCVFRRCQHFRGVLRIVVFRDVHVRVNVVNSVFSNNTGAVATLSGSFLGNSDPDPESTVNVMTIQDTHFTHNDNAGGAVVSAANGLVKMLSCRLTDNRGSAVLLFGSASLYSKHTIVHAFVESQGFALVSCLSDGNITLQNTSLVASVQADTPTSSGSLAIITISTARVLLVDPHSFTQCPAGYSAISHLERAGASTYSTSTSSVYLGYGFLFSLTVTCNPCPRYSYSLLHGALRGLTVEPIVCQPCPVGGLCSGSGTLHMFVRVCAQQIHSSLVVSFFSANTCAYGDRQRLRRSALLGHSTHRCRACQLHLQGSDQTSDGAALPMPTWVLP